jgi:predicted P-loop ATPase
MSEPTEPTKEEREAAEAEADARLLDGRRNWRTVAISLGWPNWRIDRYERRSPPEPEPEPEPEPDAAAPAQRADEEAEEHVIGATANGASHHKLDAGDQRARIAAPGNAEPLGRIFDLARLPHEWMRALLWVKRSEGGRGEKVEWYVPKSCIANAVTILTHDDRWLRVLARNDFGEVDITRSVPPWHDHDSGGAKVGQWTDTDTTRLVAWFDRANGMTLKDGAIERVVSVAAEACRFHPVREYLRGLRWDAKKRLPTMLATYFGGKDGPYASQIGTKWMISAVARVEIPGCQADCTLVLEGPQGIGKNRAMRKLVPDPAWYSETRFEVGTKDSFQNLRGKWIYLLDELDSLKRADLSRVKGFLTATSDTYRESYGRRARDFQRQTIFCGTTNDEEYLLDTSNRRFWPYHVFRSPDHGAIERDRDQLWAEAVARFDSGEPWHVDTPELRQLCEEEQGDRVQRDIWAPLVAEWLEDPYVIVEDENDMGRKVHRREPYDDTHGVLTIDVARYALEKPKGQITTADHMRIARVLTLLGYERGPQRTEAGDRVRRYAKAAPPAPPTTVQGGDDEPPGKPP